MEVGRTSGVGCDELGAAGICAVAGFPARTVSSTTVVRPASNVTLHLHETKSSLPI